jgi:hypothetical protein
VDLRAMTSRVLGMAAMAASIREGGRQSKLAAKAGGVFIDELTALQVAERRATSGADLTAQFMAVAAKAARARRVTRWFIRRRPMPVTQDIDGTPEVLTIAVEYCRALSGRAPQPGLLRFSVPF